MLKEESMRGGRYAGGCVGSAVSRNTEEGGGGYVSGCKVLFSIFL